MTPERRPQSQRQSGPEEVPRALSDDDANSTQEGGNLPRKSQRTRKPNSRFLQRTPVKERRRPSAARTPAASSASASISAPMPTLALLVPQQGTSALNPAAPVFVPAPPSPAIHGAGPAPAATPTAPRRVTGGRASSAPAAGAAPAAAHQAAPPGQAPSSPRKRTRTPASQQVRLRQLSRPGKCPRPRQ